jgi:RNA polymerase sigma-70 factor (ECF subfamily)
MTLIGRLRQGNDASAWERFHEVYSGLIEGWLRRRGVPDHVAEDVRQEVLVKVYEQIGSFDHNGRVGAFRKWLRIVMQHRLRTVQRREWRRVEDQAPDWSKLADQLADDGSELSHLWDVEHDAHVIDRLLSLVAREFKELSLLAFRRVVLGGEGVTEVAESLGMTPNAVRIAQSRVLSALRRVGEGLLD